MCLDFNDTSDNNLYKIKSKKLLKSELKHINKILQNKQKSRNKLTYFFITGIFILIYFISTGAQNIQINNNILFLFSIIFIIFVLTDFYHSYIYIKKKNLIIDKLDRLKKI